MSFRLPAAGKGSCPHGNRVSQSTSCAFHVDLGAGGVLILPRNVWSQNAVPLWGVSWFSRAIGCGNLLETYLLRHRLRPRRVGGHGGLGYAAHVGQQHSASQGARGGEIVECGRNRSPDVLVLIGPIGHCRGEDFIPLFEDRGREDAAGSERLLDVVNLIGPQKSCPTASSSQRRKEGQNLRDGRDDGCGSADVFGDARDRILDGFEGGIDGVDFGLELDEQGGVVGDALLVELGKDFADGLLGAVDEVIAVDVSGLPIGPSERVEDGLITRGGIRILQD
jgi:hypothetical protein